MKAKAKRQAPVPAPPAPPSKACLTCGVPKPRTLEYWHANKGATDGLRNNCRPCHNAKCQDHIRDVRTLARQVRAGDRPVVDPVVTRPAPAAPPPAPVPREPIGDDEDTEEIDRPEVSREPMALSTIEPEHAERYVITYAQNATPVHAGFLAALQVYCAEKQARLIVLPGRYKNATSVWTKDQEHDEWWAPELAPYLFAGRMQIGRLVVYGDMPIQPTASRPLSGLEVFVGHDSAVVGHTKIELRTVPSATRHYPRILTSTGACTIANYSKSKAGKRGEAHHTIGACVVERDPHLFHLRQIIAAEDGSFTDLDREYTAEGSRSAPPVEALILGDIHVDKLDPEVDHATLRAPDSIAAVLRPRRIVYHDTLDFDVRNHHTIHDFPTRYQRATGRLRDLVEGEVDRAIDFIDRTPGYAEPIVVRSNHDAAFDRWLREADWKADPVNARFFIEAWRAILDEYDRSGEWPDAFAVFYKLRGAGRARFLKLDESLRVADIELGFHGHNGPNGSRGTALGYSKLGAKVVIGHSHHPEICDDAVQVGVSGYLDQKYNHLPSGHLNAHCVLYASGARTLINVIGTHWRIG